MESVVQHHRRLLDFRGIDPTGRWLSNAEAGPEYQDYIRPSIVRHLPENTGKWNKMLFNVPICDCGIHGCDGSHPPPLMYQWRHHEVCTCHVCHGSRRKRASSSWWILAALTLSIVVFLS